MEPDPEQDGDTMWISGIASLSYVHTYSSKVSNLSLTERMYVFSCVFVMALIFVLLIAYMVVRKVPYE